MKKVFSFLFVLISLKGFSQVVNIKADTLKVSKNGGNAELILKNATRGLTGGFLRNMGNGRTAFVAVSSTNGWGLGGNDSTTYLNFLGTTDNRPLEFRVNNILGGKINIDSSLTLFGYSAGFGNTANGLSAFGVNAGASNTGGNASYFGTGAGYQNTGTLVTGMGYNAAYQNTHSYILALGANSKVLRDSAASYGDTSAIKYHGFGTAYPTKFMDIRGGLRVVDGTQANGYVLTSDASGNASWASAPSSGVVNTGAANRLAYYPVAAAAVDDLAQITASRAIVSDANGLPVASAVTATQIGYLIATTSDIQNQIDTKAPIANPTFTGIQKVSTTDTLSTKAYARSVSGSIDVTLRKLRSQLAKDSYDWSAIGDYNIVTNTGTDNATAFQSQVTDAQTDSINGILIPFGHNEKYMVSTPILITQGNFQIMGNAPVSNQRSTRGVLNYSGPPLGPFITASTAISSLFDYGNDLSTKPTGALTVTGLALYQKDIGSAGISGQSAAGFKISMNNNGPHRGITFRNSSFNGFQSAILMVAPGASNVVAGDVNIENCNFGGCTYAVNAQRVNDFRFVGNVAEDGAALKGWFDGAVVINDNQLESSNNTIDVSSSVAGEGNAQVEIANNYFEGNTGDYVARVVGKSYNSSVAVGTNFGLASVTATDFIRVGAINKVFLIEGAAPPPDTIAGIRSHRALVTVMSNYNPSEPSAAVLNYGALLPGTSLKGQDFYIDSMLPYATTPTAVQAWLNPAEYTSHPIPTGAVVTNNMLGSLTLTTPFGVTTTGRNISGYTSSTNPVVLTASYSAQDYVVFTVLMQNVNQVNDQSTLFEVRNESNAVMGEIIGAQTRAAYGDGWYLFTGVLRAAVAGTGVRIRFGSNNAASGPTTGTFNLAAIGMYKVPAADIEIRNSVKRVLIRPWIPYTIGAGVGTVTSVTGTAPVVSSGGTTPAISMAAATTSVPGYLTAADWTTFNAKAPIASPTFTGIPAAPTAAAATSTTQIATTAFTTTADNLKLNKADFDDSLANYPFTFRNQSLAVGDSLVTFTGTNKAVVKRIQAGTNITITSTNDSLLTLSASGSGGGDMTLSGRQTVTGVKTFDATGDTAFIVLGTMYYPTNNVYDIGTSTFKPKQIYGGTGSFGGVVADTVYSSGYRSDPSDDFHFKADATTELVRITAGGGGTSGNVIIGSPFTNIPSAKLAINSTAKGFLEPVMTTSQVNAISSPTEGLMAYDATLHLPYYYNGSAWVATPSTSSTNTFTNKRWTARVGSTTSSATPTINTDNTDIYKLTAQAAAITSFTTNLSGTPVDGDILQIQILDNGTARTITWGASFAASTVTLPTTTVISTTLSVVFQYSTTSSYGNNKWILVNSF